MNPERSDGNLVETCDSFDGVMQPFTTFLARSPSKQRAALAADDLCFITCITFVSKMHKQRLKSARLNRICSETSSFFPLCFLLHLAVSLFIVYQCVCVKSCLAKHYIINNHHFHSFSLTVMYSVFLCVGDPHTGNLQKVLYYSQRVTFSS